MEIDIEKVSAESKDDRYLVAGGRVDATSASLRFFGDELEPDEITQLLKYEPTDAYKKGEFIPNIKSRQVIAKTGSWRLKGNKTGEKLLEEQIRELFEVLTDDLTVWRELSNRFKADLFCGLWIKSWNRGISFSPQILSQISERGLKIDFDIYYIDSDGE